MWHLDKAILHLYGITESRPTATGQHYSLIRYVSEVTKEPVIENVVCSQCTATTEINIYKYSGPL